MPRIYTVEAENIGVTNAGGDADLVELDAATDKPCELFGIKLYSTSELQEAQEEWLRLRVIRGPDRLCSRPLVTNPPIPPAGGPASAAAPRSYPCSGAAVPDGVEAPAIATATVTDMPGPAPESGATGSGSGPSGRSRSAPDSGRQGGRTASSTLEEVPAPHPAAAGLGYWSGLFLLGRTSSERAGCAI